jgi:proteasome accessory factor C
VSRPRADERLRRLLAMVPWVAANDGPTVEEVCARFGIDERQLGADLELLFLCGLYPYTPDMLIEADIAGGRVWIRYADYFARPLRLTPAEGLALVAAGTALLAVPGTDSEGPLARGLAKLADALGVDPDEAVEVDLGEASSDLLATLQEAAAQSRQVEIDYYAYGRDERTTRTIDPWAVFSSAGQWYVQGRDHTRDAERLFRLDRIRSARLLYGTFERPAATTAAVYNPRPEDPVLTLELEPAASWVAEQYPNEGVDDLGGGRLRVRLRISEQAWLERLLLRLGPDATVTDGDGRQLVRDAAERVLQRYTGRAAVTSDAP